MNPSRIEGMLSDFLAGIGRLISGVLWMDGFRTGFVAGALAVLVPLVIALHLRGSRCERG